MIFRAGDHRGVPNEIIFGQVQKKQMQKSNLVEAEQHHKLDTASVRADHQCGEVVDPLVSSWCKMIIQLWCGEEIMSKCRQH
jgi:hypothetical protein